ncbi:fatty acid hydroxylase domain-containing protein 2-like [Lingula anatina]|uniref:Fatty acid hydroxylase domain-containing protein 2-like n=1 Tax=Lingula anatina TaxID=7574 RepID=A0A1S3JTW9_LINAN|nr:fatty acid hydroxylase domain-containing protein 2-like [Lingula anatina]XP_013413816.1 fatty acid hydroxylase domain-containing protein 2-like [Lingula anatina]|eukprot:XP_013413815.1 fatty acid hydroxylase domain-containing protein 2-like [Lingula anatina]
MLAQEGPVTSTESSPPQKAVRLVDSVRKAAWIIGSALITFAAFRNSVTWHLQQVWGASGDFWQRQWEKIYNFCDGNEFVIGVIGANLLALVVFWTFNALFLLVDVTGFPQSVLKYKIQPDANVPVDRKKLKNAVLTVLFNQMVIGLPVCALWFVVMRWRGCQYTPESLPTFQWVLLELLVFSLAEEFFFYYSHRTFHHPRIYRLIHKRHHEWTAPIGIIALYAHPIEHIFSNMLPVFMGPTIMGSHMATSYLWLVLALLSTTVSHCGYHLPFLPSPEAHDFHHFKFTNNFGVLGVLDRLHGTDNHFRASKAYERHVLLLSLTPMRETIPDVVKGKKM